MKCRVLPEVITPEMSAAAAVGDGAHYVVGDPQRVWDMMLAAAPATALSPLSALEHAVSLLESLARDVPAAGWLDDDWQKGADGLTHLGRLRAAIASARGK